jgi:hypothetical protein
VTADAGDSMIRSTSSCGPTMPIVSSPWVRPDRFTASRFGWASWMR